jgi:Fe2+ transport system protein B
VSSAVSETPEQVRRTERRGAAWIVASFIFCPCHLPLTLGVGAAVLSGTVVGAWWSGHPYIVGAVLTALWIAGTWRGFHYLRSANTAACPVPPNNKEGRLRS